MSNTPARRRNAVYPVTIVPTDITSAMTSPKGEGAEPTAYSRISANVTRGGKTAPATVMAFGAVNAALEGKLAVGQELRVRVAFDRAPAQGDAKRGGQCMRIVGLVEEKVEQAA
jgi:hypothetical protein